jgi:uncharacterized OB-fold protein
MDENEKASLLEDWNFLDSEDKENAIEWYNIAEEDLDDEDKIRLADLIACGQFAYWDCPNCGKKVLVGYPDNWNCFQGARQSETAGKLCEDCGELYYKLKEFVED